MSQYNSNPGRDLLLNNCLSCALHGIIIFQSPNTFGIIIISSTKTTAVILIPIEFNLTLTGNKSSINCCGRREMQHNDPRLKRTERNSCLHKQKINMISSEPNGGMIQAQYCNLQKLAVLAPCSDGRYPPPIQSLSVWMQRVTAFQCFIESWAFFRSSSGVPHSQE